MKRYRKLCNNAKVINNEAKLAICNGDSALVYGNYEITTGTYFDSLTTIIGCDSIFSTVLTVNPTFYVNDVVEICNGDSALIYGNYESVAGTYFDSLITISSCDSILSTLLLVDSNYSFIDSPLEICNGDSALIYGIYQISPGTYYDSLTTVCGFDSVYSTVLTLYWVDTSVTKSGSLLTSNASGSTYQWYDCNSNSIIIGETGQSYTPSTSGSYAVIVTQNGCTDTSSCYLITVIGIQEIHKSNKFFIQPNPTTGLFTVQGASGEIRVNDLFGRKVLTATEPQIDMRGYAKGVYFVRVGEVVRKLVLN